MEHCGEQGVSRKNGTLKFWDSDSEKFWRNSPTLKRESVIKFLTGRLTLANSLFLGNLDR
jgi:hypothetical protein